MYKNSIWMAKKHGNWLFVCKFAGMKQALPDYIKALNPEYNHDNMVKYL